MTGLGPTSLRRLYRMLQWFESTGRTDRVLQNRAWKTAVQIDAIIGTLQDDIPAGTATNAGGPIDIEVETISDAGAYVPFTPQWLQPVWNQCDAITSGTRVQCKRVTGDKFVIDVECC